jgi:pilus assembly protein CpaB
MNKKALILSVTAGIVGVLLLQFYMQRFEREMSGGAKVEVLVAAQDLVPGSPLRGEMLGIRGLPQAYIDQRHIRVSDTDKVLGAVINIGVKANESLLWTDLATMQAGGRTLSGLVQEGMRAFAISAKARFAGLLRPGDRVDVLFTARVGDATSANTSTLMQNVLVLATGADIGSSKETSAASARALCVDRGVTISVTAEQSQLLTQAASMGDLSLTLRNPGDIVQIKGLPKTTSLDITGAIQKPVLVPGDRVESEPKKVIEHVR